MTDRELLELAAKAAGIVVRWHQSSHYGPTMEIMESEAGGPPWNPLTDDGDALRLAVILRMEIYCDGNMVECRASTDTNEIRCFEAYLSDDIAATCRAITRVAAEIGKGME